MTSIGHVTPVVERTYEAGAGFPAGPGETWLTPGGSGPAAPRGARRPSEHGRRPVARLLDATLGIDAEQEERAEHEERDQGEHGRPVGPGELEHQAEGQGPEP